LAYRDYGHRGELCMRWWWQGLPRLFADKPLVITNIMMLLYCIEPRGAEVQEYIALRSSDNEAWRTACVWLRIFLL